MQQTHYDTLKVARDAPIEVIRAAYRALSQKYHPDRNPADSVAANIMGLLNNAYEVLSDPERRLAHDALIRYVEAESQVRKFEATVARPERIDAEQEPDGPAALTDRIVPHLLQFGFLYGGALLIASVVAVVSLTPRPQENPWLVATPDAEDREAMIRRLASEVMLRPGEGARTAVPVPPVPDTSDSPLDNPPSAVMEVGVPAKRAVHSGGDVPRPSNSAHAAAYPAKGAGSSRDLPAALPANEEAPIVRPAPPNDIRAAGKPLPDSQ